MKKQTIFFIKREDLPKTITDLKEGDGVEWVVTEVENEGMGFGLKAKSKLVLE